MQTTTFTTRFQFSIVVIIVLLSSFVTFASEFETQPTINAQYAHQLLYNTPTLDTLDASWREYVASINWMDYATQETADVYETAHQLLYNTPTLDTLDASWREYVASINWMDYADYNLPYFYKECVAC